MPDHSSSKRLSVTRLMDEHRALLMLLVLFVFLALFAPRFLTAYNMTTILKGASLNGIVAIGFTTIFILGQLDLSIGSVVMLCGMLAVGLQPQLGWTGSVVVSLLAGGGVGLVNGLLVVKGRINSFIVTLGTMTIVTGLMHLYSDGGSKAITDYRLADWMETPVVPFLPPMVILTLVLVAGYSLFLNRTPTGRGFFVVGGNPETAWLAGLNRDRYQISGFVICGLTAAMGGIVFATRNSSMTSATVQGTWTLMTVLAAVIIGGTLMTGGKGGVVKSYLAVLMLTTLFNGIGCFGLGFEVQIFVNGLILAIVVLYEAYVIYRHNLLKGQRADLLKETISEHAAVKWRESEIETSETEESEEMNSKDRFAIICVSIVAIVALVVVFAMYLVHKTKVVHLPTSSETVDVYALRGTDDQPLVFRNVEAISVPPRPDDPASLPKTDKGHWWDIEFAGWRVDKVKMPESPGDGPAGKKIILIKAGDHPYWTAYLNGFNALVKAHGMEAKILNSNWTVDMQAQQTEQAINERPDMIIFAPVDATACTPLLRRINQAGIPCIATNTIPCDEAMKYCLAWTGPDDWGQFRMLTRVFADAMGKTGGYAIVRHMPGGSPFFSRTYAPITELAEYAPEMKMLVMDTANLEAEGTMQLVSAWLTKYGDELKGLVLAGDGFTMTGTIEAIKKAGRDDLIIVAAGNCKTGMDSIKDGDALAITYQSAEGDGATSAHTAARWFSGEKIRPVNYLPKHIITASDVDEFLPAQW